MTEARSTDKSGAGRHAVIVGAGITGVVIARALQGKGFRVTIVERDEPGMACSYGNGGAISPDFCVPIAMPGMLQRVPKWLVDRDGPLVVRWPDLPGSLPWLIRWIRAGRPDRLDAISRALRNLHATSYELYKEILGDRASDLIEKTGQLYVWRTNAPTATETLAAKIREGFGVETRALDRAGIRELDENLAPDFERGLFFPDNGHTLNPLRLVQTFVEMFKADGGRIVRNQAVGFVLDGSRATALKCTEGALEADVFVIAAGIESRQFSRSLGDAVPLQAERGYHVMLPNPGIMPKIKVSNRDHMFGLTPMEHGLRIAGTVEIARPDAPADERRPQAMLRVAKQMYRGLNESGAETWMGCRPSTPDSLPVIDRSRRAHNVIYGFGHGHTGLTGAPMTAELVAALAAESTPPIDCRPYAVARFA